MNVLLVDDDPGFRQALEFYMKDQGKTVFSAGDGEEGLKKLREEKIDFIVSDVYMPIMDGIKFQKAVNAVPEFAIIPFLFVSGFDDDHTLEAVRNSKNCGFMKKGRPLEELEEWIMYLTTPPEKRGVARPGSMNMLNRSPGRSGRGDDWSRK